MRNHLIKRIEEYAKLNRNVVVVTADLGYSVLDNFAKAFPDQFYNVGIAEQSMASIAAGLALGGFKVIMYSIGNFTTLRCLEQIRNNICYHDCDVKIISVGGGMAYGSLGMTHHATEDIAIMRSLPNMQVYAPFDPIDAEQAIDDAIRNTYPCYIRLERNNEKIYDLEHRDINRVVEVKPGKNVAVVSFGSIIEEALAAHSVDQDIGVYSITKLKPVDEQSIVDLMLKYKTIISLEEHNLIGGLYSILSEIKSKYNLSLTLKSLSINDQYPSIVGNQKFLRHFYGIDQNAILKSING